MKIHITPTSACEHIKNKDISCISPYDIQEQLNKVFFKTIINDKKTTITFFNNTGTIQTQPKNIDIEQLLDKFNKTQEKSKSNLDKFLKRNDKPQKLSDLFVKKENNEKKDNNNKSVAAAAVVVTENVEKKTNKESIQTPTTTPPSTSTTSSKTDYIPKIIVDYSYKPPVFNNYYKENEEKQNTPTIPKKVYIAHEENKNAQDFILDILSKLNLEAVILQNEESRSLTIIENELKKCDFGIVLITHEKKVYEKEVYAQSEEGTDLHREIKLPLLNVMLEMGLLIGHFGRRKTLVIEFMHHQYQIKLCNQMNIISGIVYHQSTDPDTIRKEIKTIITSLNHKQ